MMLLTHWAGLRIGEVACLRWSDVTTSDGQIKDEIRLLPEMTKGRHARTVFVSAKLKAINLKKHSMIKYHPYTLFKATFLTRSI